MQMFGVNMRKILILAVLGVIAALGFNSATASASWTCTPYTSNVFNEYPSQSPPFGLYVTAQVDCSATTTADAVSAIQIRDSYATNPPTTGIQTYPCGGSCSYGLYAYNVQANSNMIYYVVAGTQGRASYFAYNMWSAQANCMTHGYMLMNGMFTWRVRTPGGTTWGPWHNYSNNNPNTAYC